MVTHRNHKLSAIVNCYKTLNDSRKSPPLAELKKQQNLCAVFYEKESQLSYGSPSIMQKKKEVVITVFLLYS